MYDIITIGTATQDVFLKSSEFKYFKDTEHLKKLGFPMGEAGCFALGSKIEVGDIKVTYGGGAANAAVTFARQGFRTLSFIRVGRDEIGKSIVDNLKKEGIKLLVTEDKKRKSAYSVILLLPSGERTILVYRGAASEFEKTEIKVTKLNSKWVYIAPGRIPISTMIWLTEYLKKKGAHIAMNPSGYYVSRGMEKLKPLFKNLDVVILNREEASSLTKVDYSNERAIFRKFDEIIEGIAVMTEGFRGSLVSDGRYIYRAGVYKEKKLVDRTGAGDAFGSGFVAGLIKTNDIAYALKLGAANATSVVEHIGAQEGILTAKGFREKRFKYLDLDIEPLV